MRIVSRFTDLYDAYATNAREETPLYRRETREMELPRIRMVSGGVLHPVAADCGEALVRFLHLPTPPQSFEVVPVLLVLATRVHVGYRLFDTRELLPDPVAVEARMRARLEVAALSSFDRAELRRDLVSLDPKHGFHGTSHKRTPSQARGELVDWDYAFTADGWARYAARFSAPTVSAEIHRAFRAPIVAITHLFPRAHASAVVVDPCLLDLGFGKVLDPAATFQAIEVLFGSELAEQVDPVPERTQELIRDAHGFGPESFKRAAPGEKKRRREENRARKRARGPTSG